MYKIKMNEPIRNCYDIFVLKHLRGQNSCMVYYANLFTFSNITSQLILQNTKLFIYLDPGHIIVPLISKYNELRP